MAVHGNTFIAGSFIAACSAVQLPPSLQPWSHAGLHVDEPLQGTELLYEMTQMLMKFLQVGQKLCRGVQEARPAAACAAQQWRRLLAAQCHHRGWL